MCIFLNGGVVTKQKTVEKDRSGGRGFVRVVHPVISEPSKRILVL